MFRRVPGTRPNISESHSEMSTRVPFCIAGEPAVQADLKKLQRCIMMAKAHCLYQAGTEAKDYLSCIKECTVVLSTTEGVPELLR